MAKNTERTKNEPNNCDADDIYIAGVDEIEGLEDSAAHITFDPRALEKLDPAFVANIREEGIITPVTVYVDEQDRMFVLNGRNRLLAAREIYAKNKESVEVPFVDSGIEPGDDAAVLAHIMSANWQKQVTLSQQARMAQRLIDTFTIGHEEGSDAFKSKEKIGRTKVMAVYGWSESTLRNRLELLGLAAGVVKAVDAQELLPSTALGWKKLEKSEQSAELEKLRKAGKTSKKYGQRTGSAGGSKPANDDSGNEITRPSVAVVKKLLSVPEVDEVLEPQTIKVLKWVCGLIAKPQVKGFAELVSKATAKADDKKAPTNKPDAEAAE